MPPGTRVYPDVYGMYTRLRTWDTTLMSPAAARMYFRVCDIVYARVALLGFLFSRYSGSCHP